MPRADGEVSPRPVAESASDTANPSRRSRFSLPWRTGSGEGNDEMDSGLNDRLLADGGGSLPGARRRWPPQCETACALCCWPASPAGGKKPLVCGCCAAFVLFLLVYCTVLYHAYSRLTASMPSLVIQPVKVSGFCDEEIVAHGRVTMSNQASWPVHVTAKSSKISLPGGPVAFTMHSTDRMGFAGAATTVQDAVQRMKIEDPASAGRLIQDFAVLGTATAHVEVQMAVEISVLPGVHSYLYTADHVFSSLPTGPEASIPGCLNGSTVQQQGIHQLTMLQNDPVAARGEVAVSMAWYKAWTFTAEFPPTEWRLVNKRTREPIAYAAVPAAALRASSGRAATTVNVSIPKEYAVAAGDAFRRTMERSELSVEIVGTGHAGDISGQCQSFAKLLQNFVYPVYKWDAAANATYNRDPYAPGVNPCKPSQVENYLDALLDVSSIDLVSSNGSHAWLKVTVSANITDGLDSVGNTAKLVMLNSTIPPVRVSLQRPDGGVVMTSSASFEGCLAHFRKAPYWCKQASATIIIDDAGTGMAMDHVIADFVASKVTNFTMRVIAMDVVKVLSASAVVRDGNQGTQLPTVMATVVGAYPQPVHVDLVSKGLKGTRSRIDHAQINYTDHDGFALQVSPRYPAPIVVSGQYNETVQRRLYSQWLQVDAGTINVDARCENTPVGLSRVHMDPSNGREVFPLSARINVEDALNSRCLGGNTGAFSSDGGGDQPPLQFFAEITPTTNAAGSNAKPFVFNSSYMAANTSDDSMNLNLTRGFKAESICHSPVQFSLTTPAPDFLTLLGDIDITAQSGQLVYEGRVGAGIEHDKDRADSGPQLEIRDDQMSFDFLLRVDDPLVVGSMINTWYSTWQDLAFQLTATDVSIASAPTNPVSFSHSMSFIKKDFNFENSATVVTDVVTALALSKSTETELEAAAKVVFNLTESVAQGWGFPIFDVTIPTTHFDIVTFGAEGVLNNSFGALTTSPFSGSHDVDYIGPITMTADTKDSKAAAKWVGAFVNNSLGCMHQPYRTLEENNTLSIQLIGDTTPAYQDECIFQAAMGAVSYPLFRYPYSDNATTEPHNVRVEKLQLTTYVTEGASKPDVELILVLGNGTDPSISNVMADLPPVNVILNGQLEVQEAKSKLLTGHVSFDQNRFHGLSSAALAVGTPEVGQLLSTLVETSMDNISVAYSFDMTPDTPSQKLFASVLHSASEAASSCLLNAAPTPAPASMLVQASLVERFTSGIAAMLRRVLTLAPIGSFADPSDLVDTVIEVQTTANTLEVTGRANIAAAASPLARLIGNESVSLKFGELGLDVYRGADDTGDAIGSAVVGVRLLRLSTEEIAIKVNTSTGAPMTVVSQLVTDYLTQPRVNAIARLVLRGQNDGQGNDFGAHGASRSRLSGSPEVDVDIDVRLPGSGEDFPCDPQPPTAGGTCKSMPGYLTSFSPVDGVCVYIGAGLKGLQIAVTASIPNPLPLPFTLDDVQMALHAEITNSAGKATSYNTIASGKLPNPITIPAHSDGTMVMLPCTLDNSVDFTTAGLLYQAHSAGRLTLSVGGPAAAALSTVSVSGGKYERGVWTPNPNSKPVRLTVTLARVFKGLVSVDECANTGRHFTEAECPADKCNVANPPAECLVATCGALSCGLGNSGCGRTCTSSPGCAHAKVNGRGSSETCSCQPGYCVAISPEKTKTCAKNLGPPLPAVCHGTATDGSCRYTKNCSSWRGPQGSVQCEKGRCVCSPGFCHDGKGRCVPVPHQVGFDTANYHGWVEEGGGD